LKTDKLREIFLDFFKSKKHIVFPSDTLIPNDKSLLFTSAGMNQFKPYFLGEKKDILRATSCQKCLRTGDLGEVGKTPYHHTFFEMLGNFSFGDYFKKEAIEFAWEFLTKKLNMKENDLWVSAYKEDSEAFKIWKNHIGVSESKLVKLGQDSNFWPANAPLKGPNGPCGPCSEIFFDRGKNIGCKTKNCNPDCSCSRFVEVWNLVFTQFNRVGKNSLERLSQRNIDTGMGLERMVSVLQNKGSNFEIDILWPVVKLAGEILGVKSIDFENQDLINAIVDHSRAVTFSIADGIYPSNEERGYVIRKIIRKASWGAHLLGKREPFISELVTVFSELMGKFYPEIIEKKDIIVKVIKAEEERFLSTLKDGKTSILAEIKVLAKKKKDIIEAEVLFRLHDTYGFPLELCKDIAQKNNMKVDEDGFKVLLEKQQKRSRKKSMFDESIFNKTDFDIKEKSEFIGYDRLEENVKIERIFSNREEAKAIDSGSQALVILDKTPFYPESGGQLADKGIIKSKHGQFLVEEVFKINEAILHKGRVVEGKIKKSDKVLASVNVERRKSLARAHTATHLLQSALRDMLGEHISQQGSLVDEDRLRFDFTHFKALSDNELEKIEAQVNKNILDAEDVCKEKILYDKAKSQGALAFFKDKYDKKVRVVSVSDYSKELCGGTHLDNTSEVGLFTIVLESSISSGTRRIEALVGKKAYYYWKEKNTKETEALRNTTKELNFFDKKNKELEQELVVLRKTKELKKAKKGNLLIFDLSPFSPSSLLYAIDSLRKEGEDAFIFLISSFEGKNIFTCSSPQNSQQITAKKFVSQFKDELFLKGGGRENLIQGVIVKKEDKLIEKTENCFKRISKK